MELNLKKALKVRKALEEQVANAGLPLTVNLSVFVKTNLEDPQSAIRAGEAELTDRLAKHAKLSRILAELRTSIAKANVDAGIEGLLAQAAHADRQISALKSILNAEVAPTTEEVTGELAVLSRALNEKEAATSRFGSPSRSVTVSIVSDELRKTVERDIAELRREKERLEDERTAANARFKIEIADGDARLLTELGIV